MIDATHLKAHRTAARFRLRSDADRYGVDRTSSPLFPRLSGSEPPRNSVHASGHGPRQTGNGIRSHSLAIFGEPLGIREPVSHLATRRIATFPFLSKDREEKRDRIMLIREAMLLRLAARTNTSPAPGQTDMTKQGWFDRHGIEAGHVLRRVMALDVEVIGLRDHGARFARGRLLVQRLLGIDGASRIHIRDRFIARGRERRSHALLHRRQRSRVSRATHRPTLIQGEDLTRAEGRPSTNAPTAPIRCPSPGRAAGLRRGHG